MVTLKTILDALTSCPNIRCFSSSLHLHSYVIWYQCYHAVSIDKCSDSIIN